MRCPSLGAWRNALALAVLAALAAHGRAHATDAAADATGPDGAAQLGRVEVVGSRIKRVDIETSQPVLVLERADIDRTGLVTVSEVLQQIVVNGSNLNSRINNGNDGQARVSLRNLGPNRTLVLVNGRRWVPELDGAVDLSTIPLPIVERIEVLRDGASAIYGSDAIAGVINITTRRNYEGAEAHAYLGTWEQGDGRTYSTDFTIGTGRERANVALNVMYQKQEPVFAGDREISAVPVYGLPGNDTCAGASTTTPAGRFVVPGRNNGPQPTRCVPGMTPGLTPIEGTSGANPSEFRFFDTRTDGFNFAPANYLLTPSERLSLYAQGRYELSGSMAFSTDVLVSERRSNQLLAPAPIMINPAFAGALGNTSISANNLYNPFGVPIQRFQRRFAESGGRRFAQDVDGYRYSGGFDGVFPLFGREFSWEAHALYARNEQAEISQGGVNLVNVATALGPSFVDALGVPRCGTPTNTIADCVPLDLFGAGSITPAMAEYIAAITQSSAETELTSYAANLTGDLFELPAGPLGMATGYEYRRARGSFQPDALLASGRLGIGGSDILPTSGGYSVDEAYLELNLPLLSEKPFAEIVELSLAARYSDYSNFGDTVNAKAGFRWKPHASLLLRGNWSEGFRAPSVNELFQGAQSGIGDPLNDPCQPMEGEPTAAVRARCIALGVPLQYEQPEVTNLTFGGNPGLQPETAVTRTLGLVYSPSWLGGLDLYIDWYNITIDESIGALDAQALVNRCYTLFDDGACERVTRNEQGQLFIVDATLQNLRQGTETEGFDVTVNWRRTTTWGKFNVRWDTAYVDYYGEKGRPPRLTPTGDGTLLLGNVVATLRGDDFFTGTWRIKSNVVLSWSRGDWSAALTGRYFSPLEESCDRSVAYANNRGAQYLDRCDDLDRVVDLDGDGIGDPAPTHEVDEVWFFDLQAGWDAPWNAHLTAGVRNAFDRDPPAAHNAFANSFDPAYDIPGRFWYLEYTQRF